MESDMEMTCNYPDCKCPFDMPNDKCAQGWDWLEVLGHDQEGEEQYFNIVYRVTKDGLDIDWPDSMDFLPEREIYWNNDDIIKQIKDHLRSKI